ncbi:MAG: undecaprenyl-diphosphate phosphatase [Candidatus Poribacteria bacterium]|nr:undecaprenyl-diphosphate phosphatase [Candidatus Poribacteria bacterium]
MSLWEAAVLGLVQGLTEFLPVSSSGHLVLAQHLFGLGGAENLAYDLLLHIATLFAVFIAFRNDLWTMLTGIIKRDRTQLKLAFFLILAMAPTGMIAILIKEYIEEAFNRPMVVGFMLLITGSALYITPRARRPFLLLEGIGVKQALTIGIVQGFAPLPGISRSGVTICAGIASGLQAEASARFSFLLAILAIVAASIFSISDISAFPTENLPAVGVGMVVAFASGLVSIQWLMKIARRGKFDMFAYYCFAVGTVAIVVTLLQDRIG